MKMLERLWREVEADSKKKLAAAVMIGFLLIFVGDIVDRKTEIINDNSSNAVERRKNDDNNKGAMTVKNSNEQLDQREEQRLSEILSSVNGAGQVDVRVLVTGSGRREFEHNKVSEVKVTEERNDNGVVRTTRETKDNQQVLNSKEKGSEQPVVVHETGPEISGLIIVADGAENTVVKQNLLRAAETFGVPVYKITVLPRRK